MSSVQRKSSKSRPWQEGGEDAVSFGAWLRRQREMRQIELADIADATKVSRRYLEAFEEDRLDSLPAPIFAKGFLREYAKFIGADPDEAVNHYLSAVQAAAPDEEDAGGSDDVVGSHGGGSQSWLLSLLLVIGVALALLAVYVFSFRAATKQRERQSQSSPPAVATVADPADAAAARAAARPTTEAGAVQASHTPVVDAPAPEPAEPAEPLAPIRVTLDFTANCWVEIQIDRGRRIEELRVEGESVQLEADRVIDMKLGDAGAVEVQVNGRPYSLGRGAGQVARTRIDLETVAGLAEAP